MKINNINPIQYNKIQFGTAQKAAKNQVAENCEEKVPVSSDVARAYASYGINNRKDNAIPVNNLSLEINGNEELNTENAAIVSMLSVVDKPIKAKEGLFDIRSAISDKYITALYSVGVDAVSFPQKDGSTFVGVKSSPENLNLITSMAKFLSSNAILVDKEIFEDTKKNLKSFYKENWDSMKTSKEGEYFTYSELKNAKSIDEVCEKIDNISYNDYLKYSEDILKMQDKAISIIVPQEMFDNKKIDVKNIEKQVLDNTSIKGSYEFNVIENYHSEV